jgi:hypothetical protein
LSKGGRDGRRGDKGGEAFHKPVLAHDHVRYPAANDKSGIIERVEGVWRQGKQTRGRGEI